MSIGKLHAPVEYSAEPPALGGFDSPNDSRRDLGGCLQGDACPGLAHRLVDRQLAKLLDPLAQAAGLLEGGELNLGTKDDFREPDRALWRPKDSGDWQHTVALAVEIVSPGDSTWEKLPFYAAHDVDELLIVDPQKRTVDWLALEHGEYQPVARSGLIELGPSELADRLDWP